MAGPGSGSPGSGSYELQRFQQHVTRGRRCASTQDDVRMPLQDMDLGEVAGEGNRDLPAAPDGSWNDCGRPIGSVADLCRSAARRTVLVGCPHMGASDGASPSRRRLLGTRGTGIRGGGGERLVRNRGWVGEVVGVPGGIPPTRN